MQQIDKIILARWLLPIAPENIVLEQQAIAIQGSKIIDILPIDVYLERYTAKQVSDCRQHAVLPGLVNAHTHTPMNLFRGLADDLELMDWLNHYIWPAEQAIIKPESVTDGCRFAIAEMLRSGTTCFSDNYFYHETVAQTAIAEGIRATLGFLVMNVATQYAKDEQDYFNKALATLEKDLHHDLISWSIAPHAPYTVSDATFKKIASLSAKNDLRIHLHLNETAAEVQMSLAQYQQRPIARLHQLGLINPRLMAVHMVCANDAEIQLLKEHDVNIILCPESNMKLASGFAPIEKYLNAGLNIALGTDGAASNNNLDMFGELRSMSFIAKANSQDPTLLPAAQALEIATLGGAKTLGLADKIGSIEIGKEADLIAVDLDSIFTQPVYHPMSALVYALNTSQVSDVWVAGKQLLAQGKFTRLDIKRTMDKVAAWTDKVNKLGATHSDEHLGTK
mgnify:CR=1 FL=1